MLLLKFYWLCQYFIRTYLRCLAAQSHMLILDMLPLQVRHAHPKAGPIAKTVVRE